jgi:tRNA (cmo5U34)-methyltransferase
MRSDNDNIYASQQSLSPFHFDQKVAAVFPDMIQRSVPGYSEMLVQIKKLASQFSQANSKCYDLGCSLGAASLAISYGNQQANVEIIGIDNSSAMLERCRTNIENFKHGTKISLVQEDIEDVVIENASMVVLNYTLQFIPQSSRKSVLKSIFEGLRPNGILILSEKVIFENQRINELMIDLHHQFKKDNGYSELEISQKRSALENVLVPETLESHVSRLKSIGFSHVSCTHQQLNFVSLIAIKD